MPVPFTAAKKKHIKGIVSLDADALVVELEKKPFLRAKKIITLEIPLAEIDFVVFKRGLTGGGKMVIRTLYLESTEEFLWRDGIEVTFLFSRAEREGAEDLAAMIDEALDRQEGLT